MHASKDSRAVEADAGLAPNGNAARDGHVGARALPGFRDAAQFLCVVVFVFGVCVCVDDGCYDRAAVVVSPRILNPV